MKITRGDLTLLVDGARKEYIEISPNTCLPGTVKVLTDSERIAVSWLQSAVAVLNKMGYINSRFNGVDDLVLEFNYPDSSTMTDGFDAAGEDKEKE